MPVRFKRFAIHAGLALLGVALFCGDAMAPSLAFLPYVALVPWAVLYMDPKRPSVSPLHFLGVGYLSWILCHAATFRLGWFVPIVTAPFFIPAWILFPLLARPIQRLALPRSLTLPVVWVAFEWARLLLAAGHFDVFLLGYSQARFTSLVQIADVTGVHGISFLVAAVNGLLADAVFVLKDAAWRPRILLRERTIVVPAVVIASGFAAASAYGVATLTTARESDGPRLAIVRPGVPPDGADLIVWSGAAVRDDLGREDAHFEEMASLASRASSAILFRAQGRTTGLPGRSTSSAFLLDAGGRPAGRYDKQILFPFSEYVPIDRIVGLVSRPLQSSYHALVRKAWGSLPTAAPGARMTLLTLPWNGGVLPFAVSLGVEHGYPPLVADAKRRGARFLVNLTSDGEVNGVREEQLLRVCMLRSIENRISCVRVGSSGISGFIDPAGRLRSAARGVGGGTTAVALFPGGTTIYAASRDAFALACVALSLWLLARAVLRGRPTMTPHPVPAAATP